MAIDFENALAGEHGDEAQRAAEDAVRGAVDAIAVMLKPSIDAALNAGAAMGGFAAGGIFNSRAATFHLSNGECILPIGDVLRERTEQAQSQGYTELRFNPDTRGFAYHKPDQAVGEDGRLYIRARGV